MKRRIISGLFPVTLRVWLAAGVLLAVAEKSPAADLPNFAAPVEILAAGKPIEVAGNAAPFYGDVDQDGRSDLLVGQFELGRMRIYRNLGTTTKPRFEGFEWFRTGDQIAAVPSGCNVGFVPQLVDLDGDRRTDIVTGSLHGEVFLFRRRSDGSFLDAEVLQNQAGSVLLRRRFPSGNVIGYNSTVFAHDWDGDGDMDLLLGRTSYCLVLNEGSADQPIFGDARPILVGGEPIPDGQIGPCMADWDQDGRVDLLAAVNNDLVWYRNVDVDHRGLPVFAAAKLILADQCAPRSGKSGPPPGPGKVCAICVADFNGDGRPDLIVGDEYRQQLQPVKLTDDQRTRKAVASLGRRDLFGEYHQLRKEPEQESREQRIERFRQLVGKWQEYISLSQVDPRQRFVGRVWLFARTGD